ncbi:YjzC family protein [Microcoleus sp. Pol12A5]
MSKKLLKPGEKTPVSGQYEITGPRGGSTGKEITSIKGKPLPPTPEANQRLKLTDETKH